MQAIRPGDILVIEARPEGGELLKSVLAARGHNVVAVSSAREAQHQLERFTFDAVLCSLFLQDSDGRMICHALKSTPELVSMPVGLLIDAPHEAVSGPRGAAGGDTMIPPDEWILRGQSADEFSNRVASLIRLGRYQSEIGNSIATLMKVAAGIEEQDKRVAGHCQRLSFMATALGAALGCDAWQMLALERAGFLHDIGKVQIPGAVIDKAQRLSPREMEIIQAHTVLGERLCMDVAALKPVLPIIRHHHERADGTGYPDRLRADAIPILAQIFAIPDIYDSLRTWRPYRLAMSSAGALDVLRQEVARGYWNRLIFDAFSDSVLPNIDEKIEAAGCPWPQAS
jgi:putative two-component system response regulator